jgi:hypothetical protein
VPRHVTRLVTRLITPLVVDNFTSRRLIVDYFASAARPRALARRAARHVTRRAARRRLIRLHRASRCLGTSRGSSRGGSSPLVVDYSASRRLVVDYFAYAAHPGASACLAARHSARRAARCQLLRLVQARHRLLRIRHASGCLGTSRGSSRGSFCRSSSTTPPRAGSSSTTSPPPHVRVPRHVVRLVTRRRLAARRQLLHLVQACHRLLRLHHTSGCLSTPRGSSRGSSRRSSSTNPPRAGS